MNSAFEVDVMSFFRRNLIVGCRLFQEGPIPEPRMKRSSGIPQSFLTPVNDPSLPGAMLTAHGYAVSTIDA